MATKQSDADPLLFWLTVSNVMLTNLLLTKKEGKNMYSKIYRLALDKAVTKIAKTSSKSWDQIRSGIMADARNHYKLQLNAKKKPTAKKAAPKKVVKKVATKKAKKLSKKKG